MGFGPLGISFTVKGFISRRALIREVQIIGSLLVVHGLYEKWHNNIYNYFIIHKKIKIEELDKRLISFLVEEPQLYGVPLDISSSTMDYASL